MLPILAYLFIVGYFEGFLVTLMAVLIALVVTAVIFVGLYLIID